MKKILIIIFCFFLILGCVSEQENSNNDDDFGNNYNMDGLKEIEQNFNENGVPIPPIENINEE